jgi:hypothetical protein
MQCENQNKHYALSVMPKALCLITFEFLLLNFYFLLN